VPTRPKRYVLKYVDIYLLYLGLFFFAWALPSAVVLKSPWPIVFCAAAMQLPLVTRAIDKRRHRDWRPYVVANELVMFGIAFATAALGYVSNP
jgi:hypothetical protein